MTPPAVARLTRATSGGVLGGVARGGASYLGVSVLVLRLAFVALTLAGGIGLAIYAVFWVLLPQEDGSRLREDPRGQGQLLAMLALSGVGLLVLSPFHFLPDGTITAPALLALAGVVLVWQQADASQRREWRRSATASRSAVLRLTAGAALVIAGAVGFLASRGQLEVARAGLLSTAIVVAGIALLSSPWWFAMATDLREERRERIRSQERAEVAAHLHDSVLQTLALIQKAARSPAEVTRLARSQERELRSWLYAGRPAEGSLQGALRTLAAEVENAHGIPVDVVIVGDLELDERSTALVAATREAVLNAARHSGAASIDVFAEVEPALVTVFVRDRGRGFDEAAVPEDRHGLSGSIRGRMSRHGGTAAVRTSPGEGTEIQLALPRA
jgi:signal transduction histidine kinase/phage shock protein PspC (stress-responsive transcriptional regulator)